MSSTLVKHGDRTVRKACNVCGRKDLYWGHDTTKDKGEFCSKCHVSGAWVLIERDGSAHSLVCGPKGDATGPAPVTLADERTSPFVAPSEPVTVPAATPAPTVPPTMPSDAAALMAQLFATLAPKVDESQVRAIVEEMVNGLVFPTHTVVVDSSKDAPVVIEGAHSMLKWVIKGLSSGLHVMMVGPAGTGKSTLAESAAEAVELPYSAISLSPTTPNSQILGYMNAAGEYVRTPFREAYENGGVFNFDEIDNSNPSTLAVINSGLANGVMAFPDGMVKRSENFRCVATANTYGRGADRMYVGRQQLDAATLDRFIVLDVHVDEALEMAVCASTGLEVSRVKDVLVYVRKLRKSADSQGMRVMVSPRASIGLCKWLANEDTPEDWKMGVEALVFKGMSAQDRSKLLSGAGMSSAYSN